MWKVKNVQQLHAIQLACGCETFDWIKMCKIAIEAWSCKSSIFNKDSLFNNIISLADLIVQYDKACEI